MLHLYRNKLLTLMVLTLTILLGMELCIVPGMVLAEEGLGELEAYSANIEQSNPVQLKILYEDEGGALIIGTGSSKDKKATVEYADSLIEKMYPPAPTRDSVYHWIYSGTTPWHSSTVEAKYDSDVSTNLPLHWGCTRARFDGWSRTVWWGNDPYNSTEITIGDHWWWNSITGVSISTSGGGYTVGSNTVDWSGSSGRPAGTYYMYHYFSGVSGSSIGLVGFGESSSGSHYFQSYSTWVSATCSHGTWN